MAHYERRTAPRPPAAVCGKYRGRRSVPSTYCSGGVAWWGGFAGIRSTPPARPHLAAYSCGHSTGAARTYARVMMRRRSFHPIFAFSLPCACMPTADPIHGPCASVRDRDRRRARCQIDGCTDSWRLCVYYCARRPPSRTTDRSNRLYMRCLVLPYCPARLPLRPAPMSEV
jgi:hypothetical protein